MPLVLYTGPLSEGMTEACQDRFVTEGASDRGGYTVSFYTDAARQLLAEQGVSERGNVEEAWRYALGALYGSLDEGV